MSPGLPYHTSLLSFFPTPSVFQPQLSCGHSMNCSSSLSIFRLCYPAPQCAAPGGWWLGWISGPCQVRRELITFQCCFNTLCKEQSVLISIDYRWMLIQCHADRLQRENESITRILTVWFLQQTNIFKRNFYCTSLSVNLSLQLMNWNIFVDIKLWFYHLFLLFHYLHKCHALESKPELQSILNQPQ